MRVLALSNEPRPGADPDIPWALQRLTDRNVVDAFHVCSTPTVVETAGRQAAGDEIAAAASELRAEVVAFFHTGSCLLDAAGLDAVRRAAPGAVWLYREGDPFQRWVAPYKRHALPTVARCQLAFPFCGGYLAHTLRRAGCRHVAYAPSWVNTERYPRVWGARDDHRHDVVFVGNNVRSRRRPFPGARTRRRLVHILQRTYGARLAVYGHGWSGVGARGPCRFEDLGRIYAGSRVCVGIDHAVGPFQFSNRLPIALAHGIPLAHSSFVGASELLDGLDDRLLFDGVAGAPAVIDRLLDLDPDAGEGLSATQRSIAERMSCDRVLGYMLATADALLKGDDPGSVANPWLQRAGERL